MRRPAKDGPSTTPARLGGENLQLEVNGPQDFGKTPLHRLPPQSGVRATGTQDTPPTSTQGAMSDSPLHDRGWSPPARFDPEASHQ